MNRAERRAAARAGRRHKHRWAVKDVVVGGMKGEDQWVKRKVAICIDCGEREWA